MTNDTSEKTAVAAPDGHFEFEEVAAAVEREEIERRLQVALSAHLQLHSPHPVQQHDGVVKAYGQACALLIPVRHRLLQVAA